MSNVLTSAKYLVKNISIFLTKVKNYKRRIFFLFLLKIWVESL